MEDSNRPDEAVPPPYAAWSYFESLIQRAGREDVPARVDKALLREWGIAAGNESSLVTSLRSLGLVDRRGRPTPDFRALRLSPPRRREALQRSFERAYPGLPYDLEPPISPDELHDYFVDERGLTGQMVEKAMRFYRRLAEAARESIPPAESPPGGNGPLQRTTSGADDEAPPGSDEPAGRAAPGRAQSDDVPISVHAPQTPRADDPTFRAASKSTAPVGRAEQPPLALNLTIAVPLDASEEDLAALFRRVRRAWTRVFEDEG